MPQFFPVCVQKRKPAGLPPSPEEFFAKKYSKLDIKYRIYTNYTHLNTISQGVSRKVEQFLPKKQEKEVISIRISTDLLATVDRKSASFDVSRNEFINQCILFALQHMGEQ